MLPRTPLTWNIHYSRQTATYMQKGLAGWRLIALSRDSSRLRTNNLDTKREMSYSHLAHLDAYSTYPTLSSSVTFQLVLCPYRQPSNSLHIPPM